MSKFQLIIASGQYETVLPFNTELGALAWIAAATPKGEWDEYTFTLIEK